MDFSKKTTKTKKALFLVSSFLVQNEKTSPFIPFLFLVFDRKTDDTLVHGARKPSAVTSPMCISHPHPATPFSLAMPDPAHLLTCLHRCRTQLDFGIRL